MLSLLLLVGFVGQGEAQATLTRTTLSSAVTDATATTIVVASATGFTAGTTMAYIDREAMDVVSISGDDNNGRGVAGVVAVDQRHNVHGADYR